MQRILSWLLTAIALSTATSVARAQSSTVPAGVGVPFSNLQDSLALNYFVPQDGIFPSEDSFSDALTLGNVRLTARNYANPSSAANGQLKAISQNTALHYLLGSAFGGDGQVTFALPDLAGRTAVGAGAGPGLNSVAKGDSFGSATVTLGEENLPPHVHQLPPFDAEPPSYTELGGQGVPFSNLQPSLGLRYLVATNGIFPTEGGGATDLVQLGQVALFAGDLTPGGWAEADGRLLTISENTALFAVLGTTYGGDGQETFALPDLRGRTIVGAGSSERGTFVLGEADGTEETFLNSRTMPAHNHVIDGLEGPEFTSVAGGGAPLDNMQPYLALNYAIVAEGIFPSYDQDPIETVIGEIVALAGNFIPGGLLPADGRLLGIESNYALYALLGNTYGGDGVTTFALPDLRGRTVVGAGEEFDPGDIQPLAALRSSVLSEDCECECSPVYAPGDTPGDNDPKLTYRNLPSHSHPVPEPSTLVLAAIGLAGAAFVGRRARRSMAA